MVAGNATLVVTSASTGPDKTVAGETFTNVLRFQFDFGRSILIVEFQDGTKKEFQYDDLTGITWVPASNTITITNL